MGHKAKIYLDNRGEQELRPVNILERCKQIYIGILSFNDLNEFIFVVSDEKYPFSGKNIVLYVIRSDKIYSNHPDSPINKPIDYHIEHLKISIKSRDIIEECPDLDESNIKGFFNKVNGTWENIYNFRKTKNGEKNLCSALLFGKFVHGTLNAEKTSRNDAIFFIENEKEKLLNQGERKNYVGGGNTLYFNNVFTQPKHITQLEEILKRTKPI